ncbi:MAG: hypothetical protein IPG90_21685 [Bacteroidetes bacterium]|nr:hypothetical protein [Bacteroidota bacterium]
MDIHGKKDPAMKAEYQSMGMNNLVWDGLDANKNAIGSGIYLCKISNGNNFISKEFSLIKPSVLFNKKMKN